MKQVVITGAAGGIGSAIARIFAENSCFVYAVDIDCAACDALADSIGRDRCCPVALDVTDRKALADFAASLPESFRLDHIITLAGRAIDGEWLPLEQIDPEIIEKSIRTNLTGHILTVQTLYPFLKGSTGDKSVTLISSINAKACFGLPVYSAAKAGLSGFMSGALKDFGTDGIRINVVSPGTVVTPATLEEPKDFEHLLRTTALHRFVTPEDVAKMVWQVTTQFTTVTGHDFIIDAGQLRSHGV